MITLYGVDVPNNVHQSLMGGSEIIAEKWPGTCQQCGEPLNNTHLPNSPQHVFVLDKPMPFSGFWEVDGECPEAIKEYRTIHEGEVLTRYWFEIHCPACGTKNDFFCYCKYNQKTGEIIYPPKEMKIGE